MDNKEKLINQIITGAILRIIALTFPGFLFAGITWYFKQDYDEQVNTDILGVFALCSLAWIATWALFPESYSRYGRIVLFGLICWILSSIIFRILSVLNLIDSHQRLEYNSVVAFIIVLILAYIIWIHKFLEEVRDFIIYGDGRKH